MPKKKAQAKVPLIIRLPKDLHKHLTAAAKADDRSLNNMVIQLLRQGLAPRRFAR